MMNTIKDRHWIAPEFSKSPFSMLFDSQGMTGVGSTADETRVLVNARSSLPPAPQRSGIGKSRRLLPIGFARGSIGTPSLCDVTGF